MTRDFNRCVQNLVQLLQVCPADLQITTTPTHASVYLSGPREKVLEEVSGLAAFALQHGLNLSLYSFGDGQAQASVWVSSTEPQAVEGVAK